MALTNLLPTVDKGDLDQMEDDLVYHGGYTLSDLRSMSFKEFVARHSMLKNRKDEEKKQREKKAKEAKASG